MWTNRQPRRFIVAAAVSLKHNASLLIIHWFEAFAYQRLGGEERRCTENVWHERLDEQLLRPTRLRHCIPNFPKEATPELNPDEDLKHTNAAVGAINEEAEDGPSIVNVLDLDEAPDEASNLCQENVQSMQQTLDQMPPSQTLSVDSMRRILQEPALNPHTAMKTVMQQQPQLVSPQHTNTQAPTVSSTIVNNSSCAASAQVESVVAAKVNPISTTRN
eukprot:743691-Amphidinium_carterae.1